MTRNDLKQHLATASRVFMGALYFAAGVNHFYKPGFYLNIMPPWIPAHAFLVQLSGVAEILLGIGVILAPTRRISAWLIIAMLIAFMPVHIHMIINAASFGVPLWALWLRIPLQGLLIAWAWCYTRPVLR